MNFNLLENGVGIDCREDDFHAVYVKRQWSRVRILDRLDIPNYREVGAAACGARYRQFLRANGLKAPWTVVALARSSVLLRQLTLPKAVESQLARAVEYELD